MNSVIPSKYAWSSSNIDDSMSSDRQYQRSYTHLRTVRRSLLKCVSDNFNLYSARDLPPTRMKLKVYVVQHAL